MPSKNLLLAGLVVLALCTQCIEAGGKITTDEEARAAIQALTSTETYKTDICTDDVETSTCVDIISKRICGFGMTNADHKENKQPSDLYCGSKSGVEWTVCQAEFSQVTSVSIISDGNDDHDEEELMHDLQEQDEAAAAAVAAGGDSSQAREVGLSREAANEDEHEQEISKMLALTGSLPVKKKVQRQRWTDPFKSVGEWIVRSRKKLIDPSQASVSVGENGAVAREMPVSDTFHTQLRFKLDEDMISRVHTLDFDKFDKKEWCKKSPSKSDPYIASIKKSCEVLAKDNILGCYGRLTQGSYEGEGCEMCRAIVKEWGDSGAGSDACTDSSLYQPTLPFSKQLCMVTAKKLKESPEGNSIKSAYLRLRDTSKNPAEAKKHKMKLLVAESNEASGVAYKTIEANVVVNEDFMCQYAFKMCAPRAELYDPVLPPGVNPPPGSKI